MIDVTAIGVKFARMNPGGRVLSLAFLSILAVLPYLHTLSYPFVWDDAVFIEKNAAVQRLGSIESYFTDPDTLSSKSDYNRKIYRPLRTLLFAISCDLFGSTPAAFRLFNIALHLGCVLLLFSVGLSITGNRRTAFVAAALFAVHPVHAEAVTWVSSLADGLSTFFYLITLRVFLTKQPVFKSLAIGLLFPLALLSKEMTITFPFALALLYWCSKDVRSPSYGRRWWYLGASAVVAGIYFMWRMHVLGSAAQAPVTWSVVLGAVGRIHLVLFEYIRMLAVPHPLCSLRSWLHWSTVSILHNCAAAVSLALLVGLVWWARTSVRRLAFFCTAFVVSLLPVLGCLPVVVHVAERFAYLPSIWFCLAVAEGLTHLETKIPRRGLITIFVVVTTLVFGTKLILVNRSWQSSMSVFRAQVRCAPPAPNAYFNLGNAEVSYKRWDRALAAYSMFLSFDTGNPQALNNLAYVYLQLKAWDRAEAASRKSLMRVKNDRMALNNLGAALLGKGNVEGAIEIYRRIVLAWPQDFLGQLNLGVSLAAAGHPEVAKQHYLNAQRIRPDDPRPRELIRRIDDSDGGSPAPMPE